MRQQTRMLVFLTAQEDALVRQLVETAQYAGPVEVMREALSEWHLTGNNAQANRVSRFDRAQVSCGDQA